MEEQSYDEGPESDEDADKVIQEILDLEDKMKEVTDEIDKVKTANGLLSRDNEFYALQIESLKQNYQNTLKN